MYVSPWCYKGEPPFKEKNWKKSGISQILNWFLIRFGWGVLVNLNFLCQKKHITLRGPQMLCYNPETPTEWKSEGATN